MGEVKTTIVLPVYADQQNLDRILAELWGNSPGDSWEIIVIDDGSPQPLDLTPIGSDRLSLIRHETRQGSARARNAGVKQARGEFIVFLSVFLKIPQNYMSQISSFIDNQTFDVAQHLLVKEPGLTADHFQAFLVDQRDRVYIQKGNTPIKNTQFAAAIIKKTTFDEVNGFDDNMNHYGGHELDLAYRLNQKGYSKRILVDNLPLERTKLESHDSVRDRLQQYGRVGLPALLKKHPEIKPTILPYPAIWTFLKMFGLSRLIEKRLARHIEQDWELPKKKYRLYLHLIVRNAWDAR